MKGENHLALWAALTALFGNLVAINLLALLGDEDNPWAQLVVAFFTAIVVAAAIYSKQRWDDEKAKRAAREGKRDVPR